MPPRIPGKFANIWEIQQMEQERASRVTLMAYTPYLGSCNVAVQEISQVRKENISNEQKKNDYSHTQVFNDTF